ncbi:hypothetical protein RJT34_12096 [Clitoria ternatea]|uniref:Uncharacterized protein n=1 Tax=Clitoria ternatea TaxID=43366 RepID=A0AAN9PJ08_CLITE
MQWCERGKTWSNILYCNVKDTDNTQRMERARVFCNHSRGTCHTFIGPLFNHPKLSDQRELLTKQTLF